MKEVTKIMINDFKIFELGYDFLGYRVDKKSSLDFHHLLVTKKHCKVVGLGEGYDYFNGCILNHNSSHPYLHTIEAKDYDRFCYLTSEMFDMKIKGYLDIDNLRKIAEILRSFEKEYCSARTRKGKILIKEEFIKGRMIR